MLPLLTSASHTNEGTARRNVVAANRDSLENGGEKAEEEAEIKIMAELVFKDECKYTISVPMHG